MLAHPTAAAALLLLARASAAPTQAQMTDFMRAMDARGEQRERRERRARRRLGREDYEEFHSELRGSGPKSADLRKKIIERATVVKKPGQRRAEGADAKANAEPGERKLQNNGNNGYGTRTSGYNPGHYYNNNNAYNSYGGQGATYASGYAQGQAGYGYNNGNDEQNRYYNNPSYWQQDAQQNYNYQAQNAQAYRYNATFDGMDDYFQTYGDWDNEFGFDPTQFSLSYHRCASVRQFDDEVASSKDSANVFLTKRFAVFRFCPEKGCMGWKEEVREEFFCDEEYYGRKYCEYMEEYAEYMKQTREYKEKSPYYRNGDKEEREWDEEVEANETLAEEVEEAYGEMAEQNNTWRYGDVEEEEELYGARGEGCQSNYGEYMMELEDYLQIMLEWQESRFVSYCKYCEDCMYKVYSEWLNSGGDHRKLSFEEFKASEEHDQIRKLEDIDDEDLNDDDMVWKGKYYMLCPEYDTCSEYYSTCNYGIQDDWSQYFECSEVEKNNGMTAYVGPRCSEDGFTITLGVFADKFCSEYIGYGTNIKSYIGDEMDYEEDTLKSYYNSMFGPLDQLKYTNEENVCIPCRKGGLMWNTDQDWEKKVQQYQSWEQQYSQRKQGQDDDDIVDDQFDKYDEQVASYYDDDYDANVEVNELCGNLYAEAARCDKHYRTYNAKSKQKKYAEAVTIEDLSCDFIDSVVMGNYDEFGYISMGGEAGEMDEQPGWMGSSVYAQQAGQAISKVTPTQVFLLTASIVAVGVLAAWSNQLHKSLSKTGPWRPRRGFRPTTPSEADQLSRQNSGIIMGRSM